MKKRPLRTTRKNAKGVNMMIARRSQTLIVSISIAALLLLWMPSMACAQGLPVVQLQALKTVQVVGVALVPPGSATPPNQTPPQTPPETPPEVPPNTPPDTPPEVPPETPPDNPPNDEGGEKPPANKPPAQNRKVLPYTGGNEASFMFLGLVILLAGATGLYASVWTAQKERD